MPPRSFRLLLCGLGPLVLAASAQGATPEQVEQFSALLKSRVSTPEAIEAVRDTPPAEYARWPGSGQERLSAGGVSTTWPSFTGSVAPGL
jgi:hypothetical protein